MTGFHIISCGAKAAPYIPSPYDFWLETHSGEVYEVGINIRVFLTFETENPSEFKLSLHSALVLHGLESSGWSAMGAVYQTQGL